MAKPSPSPVSSSRVTRSAGKVAVDENRLQGSVETGSRKRKEEPKVEPEAEPKEEFAEKTPTTSRKKPKKAVKEKSSAKIKRDPDEVEDEEEEEGVEDGAKIEENVAEKRRFAACKGKGEHCCFIGEPVERGEAERRWPDRYRKQTAKSPSSYNREVDDDLIPAKYHYEKAEVDGVLFELHDDVFVKAEGDMPNYIGRIVELFLGKDGCLYFTAQWFFRAEDTVIGPCSKDVSHDKKTDHDPKRLFISDEKNTNQLDCIVSKITIIQVDDGNRDKLPPCDFYFDMKYSLSYTSFMNLNHESRRQRSASSSTVTSDVVMDTIKEEVSSETSAMLLDLYSGCGAMSTGLCTGAHLAGLKLKTAWAVDINSDACSSLQLNHPETKVYNMGAESYLALLKEWDNLCTKYIYSEDVALESDNSNDEEEVKNATSDSDEEFEVDRFLDICYGDPAKCGIDGLKLKVRWKGYESDEDSWEPIQNLGDCQERLREFVRQGRELNILPCPGDVDVICGGPPCQGISGFNRFRDRENPLRDEKNKQIKIFMDIVEHLKPKYVLMENVVDLLKFSNGYLGRYAVSRLIKMDYQSRLGIVAAGCYGLPQFRGRAFLWGALTSERLPQFPLPSHHVVVRGVIPTEFEKNLVAFDENQSPKLEEALRLSDAISDLPPVENDEGRDVMPYDKPPQTKFQKYIRLSKSAMMRESKTAYNDKLFDHRPLKLNDDDYQRVQRIPVKKGANFRDLPGLRIREDKVVELDPTVERVYLPSGKPLVPDYAISFIKGKSLKPFGRLWWDEIVPTVVTRAEPHNQVILHPEQARVLTIRENARLQGFPDHYQLYGTIKERYKQVGNAVAFPAARALGYGLGKAYLGLGDDEPVMILPEDYLG